MSIVIKAERLGKKYILRHQQQRYYALRDVMAETVKKWAGRISHPLITRDGQDPRHEEFWALDDVSFEIKEGDRVGIIGRNGAGKSTLLKILSRITEPTTGRVSIDGRVASLLEVGTGFHPELTGRENIYLNGAILGMTKREIKRKFDEIVDFAEIEKFLDTPVKRYSSGMYVRLAFAVAAHLEPEVLVVDEVLAVGDAQFQKKCLGKMEDVGKEGRTVLFVSHNMSAVQRLCTRGIFLQKGRLFQHGAASEVINAYLSSGGDTSFAWNMPAVPAGKIAYIEKVFLCDQNGNQTTYVETGSTLRVSFEFVIVKPSQNLQVSVGLLDDYGGIILGSSPQDWGIDPPKMPGRYTAIVEFPQDLLLGKSYGIRAALWTPEGGPIDGIDALRFFAQETVSLGNSTPGGRAGIIALRCKWHIASPSTC